MEVEAIVVRCGGCLFQKTQTESSVLARVVWQPDRFFSALNCRFSCGSLGFFIWRSETAPERQYYCPITVFFFSFVWGDVGSKANRLMYFSISSDAVVATAANGGSTLPHSLSVFLKLQLQSRDVIVKYMRTIHRDADKRQHFRVFFNFFSCFLVLQTDSSFDAVVLFYFVTSRR